MALETCRRLFQKRAIGDQIEPRVFDGNMPQERAQRRKQSIDITPLCLPRLYRPMAKVCRKSCGRGKGLEIPAARHALQKDSHRAG